MHILLLLGLSITYLLLVLFHFFMVDAVSYLRVCTVQYFILGIQDIFVSFMMWFVTDDENQPTFMENPNTGEIYQMLDVIKDLSSEIESAHNPRDSNYINDESCESEHLNYMGGLDCEDSLPKRMFNQFLNFDEFEYNDLIQSGTSSSRTDISQNDELLI